MGFPIPEVTFNQLLDNKLLLSYRFGVFFFIGGVVPNPLDIRFQKVKGLSATVKTSELAEGGQNLYKHKLPEGVEYKNLVLERGLVVGSPLNLEFNTAMSLFKFAASNVLVILFSAEGIPMSAWFFYKAYPVSWSTSDLDATDHGVVIDTLELAYARMQSVRI